MTLKDRFELTLVGGAIALGLPAVILATYALGG